MRTGAGPAWLRFWKKDLLRRIGGSGPAALREYPSLKSSQVKSVGRIESLVRRKALGRSRSPHALQVIRRGLLAPDQCFSDARKFFLSSGAEPSCVFKAQIVIYMARSIPKQAQEDLRTLAPESLVSTHHPPMANQVGLRVATLFGRNNWESSEILARSL